MKIFRSSEIANVIALVAVMISLFSAVYAFRSYKFSTAVVMAERKNELIRQLESVLSKVDALYGEYELFLKESDYRLPNDAAILLGKNRKLLREMQGDFKRLLSELETKQLPVDPYYLGDAERQYARYNQRFTEFAKQFDVIKAGVLGDSSKASP